MRPVPLGQIYLSWRDHLHARWWLGLMYRRPAEFRTRLSQYTKQERSFGLISLALHFLPYLAILWVFDRYVLYLNCPPLKLADILDIHVPFILGQLAFGITLGIAFGRVLADEASGMIVGIVSAILFEIAGITFWVGFERTAWTAHDVLSIVPFGIVFGGSVGIVLTVVLGRSVGLLGGVVFGIAMGTGMGLLARITVDVSTGIAGGITIGIASAGAALRAYYCIPHLVFLLLRPHGRYYPFHPVAWDDNCSIPLSGLDGILVTYAEQIPDRGPAEIERLIAHYPSQRSAAFRARTTLLARETGRTSDLSKLDEIVARLPEGEKGFLGETRHLRDLVGEVVHLQARLNTVDRPILREPMTRLLCKEIENFRYRVGGLHEPLSTEFHAAAERWLTIAQRQLREVKAILDKEPTAQVFRAGDPVNCETEAYVPRNAITNEIGRQLLLSTGCPGLVLYGRRRMGKSTVLDNLPGLLPPSVRSLRISMQDPDAFTSLASLVGHLMTQIRTAWPDGPPDDAPHDLPGLFRYLSACNDALGGKGQRFLLGLDEYENLDEKIGTGVFPVDILAMLRESIQSHRNLTWMFAGTHEITELAHAPWTSYLVSARTINVSGFTEAETRLLLTEPLKHSTLWPQDDPQRPRPRFAPEFWGEGGIERIHAEAGGWPHLVQLIAETTVDLLNDEDTRQVTSALMERALAKAIVSGHNVLYELMHRECRVPGEWEYLSAFRTRDTQPPPDDEAIVRSLRRRLLIAEEAGLWRLRVPLMHRWLRARG